MNLIPKGLNKQHLIIWKNFTLWDGAYFLVFSGAIGGIAYGTGTINWIFGMLLGIILWCFFAATLLESEIYCCKFYLVIFNWFRYLGNVKKYGSVEGVNNLLPYKKIINQNFIETKILTSASTWNLGCIEVKGFNLGALSPEEQLMKIEELTTTLRLLDCNVSLVKLSQPIDFKIFSKNLLNLKVKINIQKQKKELSETQDRKIINQLDYYNTDFYKEKVAIEKQFYLFVYHTNLNDLNNYCNIAIDKLLDIGCNAKLITSIQLINVIKNIFNPFEKEIEEKDIKDNKLNGIFPFKYFEFKNKYFKINNTFYSINGIFDYPVFPNNGWLARLSNNDFSFIANIANSKQDEVKKHLQKAYINAQTNLKQQKKILDIGTLNYQINAFEDLINSLVSGEETVKKVNCLFLNVGDSLKELHLAERRTEILLKENGCKLHKLQFNQQEAFSAFLPKPTDPIQNLVGREMPCATLAGGFPFLNNSLKDEKGLYLGTNSTGDIINWDQFVQDQRRQNFNLIIMGKSGSGKSHTAKKIANWHINNGRKVILIDPERENKQFCKFYNGDWIDVGNATAGRINPFQIMGTFDENESNNILLSNHLQLLENWFNILLPDLNGNELRYLINLINKFYKSFFNKIQGFKVLTYMQLLPKQFPTFDNFLIFLNSLKDELSEFIPILKKIISIVEFNFTGSGKYAQLYNGVSTISLKNNLLSVFDIYSLFEKGDKKIIQAQLFLVLAYIQNEVKINRFATQNEIVLMVDEAHLIIDKDNPAGLNFMYQMVKRIRKYRGAMILITQNPDDFLGSEEIRKKTMAMINNTQYMLVMNLSPQNLNDIAEMFRTYGGLSGYELDYIAKANRGQGLFLVSGYNRHCIQIELSKHELEAFNGTI